MGYVTIEQEPQQKQENGDHHGCAGEESSESECAFDVFENSADEGKEDSREWSSIELRGHDIFVELKKSYVWPSAQLLAEWIFDHPEEVHGKRVLELGCGIGLPSMAAAKVGAEKVIATDRDDNYLEKFRDVCAYNQYENVSTLNVDWFAVQSNELHIPQVDIVLCADVNYYSSAIGALAHCIAAAGRTCLLVSREGRISLDEFIDHLQVKFGYSIMKQERLSNESHGKSDDEKHSLWLFQRDP